MIRSIAGDSSLPLRHLILNLVLFVALAAGTYFFVSDTILGLGFSSLAFDLVLITVFGTLYWLSRRRGHYRIAAHLGALGGLLFFCVNYLFNGGLAGPTLLVVLMVLSFVTFFHSPRASIAYLVSGSLLTLACIAADYLNPGLVRAYVSRDVRFLDVTFTFVFCLLMLSFVMHMVMRFFRDAMARSQAEQAALLQSEKMASLGEIAANISHEIATPIGVIGSAVSVAQDWWQGELRRAPGLLLALGDDQVRTFLALLAQERTPEPALRDSRTQRAQRQALAARLRDQGHGDPEVLAEDLVDLGWPEWDDRWATLLRDEPGRAAFSFLLKTLTLERANRYAAAAYERIGRLLEALGSYSRTETPESPPTDTKVEEGLDTVLTLYGATHRGTVDVVRVYRPLPLVRARGDELIQVWTNLVQNALHAMGGKGVLTVETEKIGPWVQVAISDTGPGVPVDLRQKIFTPFFTTKERGVGTGLGLGIVSRIVAAHGGQVEVTDAPGGGARFVVRLPAAPGS